MDIKLTGKEIQIIINALNCAINESSSIEDNTENEKIIDKLEEAYL